MWLLESNTIYFQVFLRKYLFYGDKLKKGSLGLIPGFILGIVIFVLFIVALSSLVGEDSMPRKLYGYVKNFVQEKTLSPHSGKGFTCEGSSVDNPTSNKNLIMELAEKTKDSSVPISPQLAAAIGKQESNFVHCLGGKILTSNYGSLGLMQVNPTTGNSECSGYNIYDREENAKCGIIILQNKYKTIKQEGYYERVVNKYCPAESYPENNQKYLSYKDDWKRAVRAYNGFGCSAGADVDYVEKVYRWIENG